MAQQEYPPTPPIVNPPPCGFRRGQSVRIVATGDEGVVTSIDPGPRGLEYSVALNGSRRVCIGEEISPLDGAHAPARIPSLLDDTIHRIGTRKDGAAKSLDLVVAEVIFRIASRCEPTAEGTSRALLDFAGQAEEHDAAAQTLIVDAFIFRAREVL